MKLKRRNKLAFFFLLIIAITGCAVHQPQTISLPVSVPESFVELAEPVADLAAPVSEPAAPDTPIKRWWESFNDPKLNALMQEAFSSNLDLAQAYTRLDQLQAIHQTSLSTRFPSLNAAVQLGREDTPGFFGNNTGNSHTLSLAASYELDIWQKLSSQRQAASLEVAASQEGIKALYLTLSAQLVDIYYLAVEQRAQLELTDNTIKTFADILDRVEQRYNEGLVPALDIYQAQYNLAGAKSRRPVFESTLAQTEHALAILLGHYPEPNSNMAGDVVKLSTIPAAFPAGLPSEILAKRPDIEAALLRLKASDARIAVAIANRFPSFNLLGSYGTSSIAFSTGNIQGAFWKVLVDAALPLVDWGRRKAEVNRNKAVFQENMVIYHKTVLKAFKEVEDALVRNRTTEERIARLGKKLEAAEAVLRLSLEQYLQGVSGYLPVLTAQAMHFSAGRDILSARRQLISDRVSLARALGGEWMTLELQQGMQSMENVQKMQKRKKS